MTWDQRWAAAGPPGDPSPWLVESVERWAPPAPARALDVAGGNGRHALWLAARGYECTLCDWSRAALDLARVEADSRGLELHTDHRNLEVGGFPPGHWDLVVVIRFFDRSVVATALEALAPGGVLFFSQPTRRNLERHDRPDRRFLAAEGEIAAIVDGLTDPLEILTLDEDWRENDAHEVRLVARRPGPDPATPTG